MEPLKHLMEEILNRVNARLVERAFSAGFHAKDLIPRADFPGSVGICGSTARHPAFLQIVHSNVDESFFLGRCIVDHSILYKTVVRGDELKRKGDSTRFQGIKIPIWEDEAVRISNSLLIHCVVHSNSHDLGRLEEYGIQDTLAMHYANIHGSPVEGCYLGPLATLDLTPARGSILETFSYVQTGELIGERVESGRVWIRAGETFEFDYRFDPDILKDYVRIEAGKARRGAIVELLGEHSGEIERRFTGHPDAGPVPAGACVSEYAVVKGKSKIDGNVYVAPRAFLEDADLGRGSNAQEHCYLIGTHFEGNDVAAHGAKVIRAWLDRDVFVGFNSFLRGGPGSPLKIGAGCIVMPHTIMDLEEPLEVPPEHLVWGFIRNRKDLAVNSFGLAEFSKLKGETRRGGLLFRGDGDAFVDGFKHRIRHILESNGAFSADGKGQGHAQNNRDISSRVLKPSPEGEQAGLYPSVDIRA